MLDIINTPEKKEIVAACMGMLGETRVKELSYNISKLIDDKLVGLNNGECLITLVFLASGARQCLDAMFNEATENMEE